MTTKIEGQWQVTMASPAFGENTVYLVGDATYADCLTYCANASATLVRARYLTEAALWAERGMEAPTPVDLQALFSPGREGEHGDA